jgi:hypothetical protein
MGLSLKEIMEVKSQVLLEVKKNDRVYTFSLPMGAPFGECYDACFESLQKILELAQQSAEKARPQESNDSDQKA